MALGLILSLTAGVLALVVPAREAEAGCDTNPNTGVVVCGPGACAVDANNGVVRCSRFRGGGAAVNANNGRVICGFGGCAVNRNNGVVICSPARNGSAATNANNGVVVCTNGNGQSVACVDGSAENCLDATVPD